MDRILNNLTQALDSKDCYLEKEYIEFAVKRIYEKDGDTWDYRDYTDFVSTILVSGLCRAMWEFGLITFEEYHLKDEY